MVLFKVLYISVLMILKPDNISESQYSLKCDDLTIKANVTYSEGKGSKLEIEVKGGTAPYTYIFYKESGHLISSKFDKNSVEGLQRGKYACTVSDKGKCKKTIEIEIK